MAPEPHENISHHHSSCSFPGAGMPALCHAADELMPFDADPYMPAGAPDDMAHMQRGGRAPQQ